MEGIVLIGGGGHALSVADAVISGNQYEIAGYTDVCDTRIPLRYLGTDAVLESLPGKGILNAAVTVGCLGGSRIRETLYQRAKQAGAHTFIGANATIIQEVQVGMNAVIGAGSVVIGNVPDNGRVVGLGGG